MPSAIFSEAKEKTCFVIAPIDHEGSETRKRSDSVLKHIFREALVPRGYTVTRADEISQPGSITVQVIERVINADLVIADLTDHNPNVFYELAVRHAIQKPLIHVIAAGQNIPFDVADFRTILIELDLDGAAKARKELAAQLTEIEKGETGVTPVKLAGVLIELGKSTETGDSEEKLILRQLIEGLSEIRAELRSGFDLSWMRTEKIVDLFRQDREDRHLRLLQRARPVDAVQGESSRPEQPKDPAIPIPGSKKVTKVASAVEEEAKLIMAKKGVTEQAAYSEAIQNVLRELSKDKKPS